MTAPHPPCLSEPGLTTAEGVRHAFFTRQGGVSRGVYDSLNVGYGSDDSRENVAENRWRAMAVLGQPVEALNTIYQVHSPDVVVADRLWSPDRAPQGDAMVSDQPGIVLGILTADCVPVLFAGKREDGRPVIGAAHAGWRGALGGVLEATVGAMESLRVRRDGICAAIGPCIGAESYEVGPEFGQPFIDKDPENGRFFAPGRREGHPLFDIAGYVAAQLQRLGLAGVGMVEADTCADADLFYSYRRKTLNGEADYGRQLSAIVIEA